MAVSNISSFGDEDGIVAFIIVLGFFELVKASGGNNTARTKSEVT
jgi:hypothetical protein